MSNFFEQKTEGEEKPSTETEKAPTPPAAPKAPPRAPENPSQQSSAAETPPILPSPPEVATPESEKSPWEVLPKPTIKTAEINTPEPFPVLKPKEKEAPQQTAKPKGVQQSAPGKFHMDIPSFSTKSTQPMKPEFPKPPQETLESAAKTLVSSTSSKNLASQQRPAPAHQTGVDTKTYVRPIGEKQATSREMHAVSVENKRKSREMRAVTSTPVPQAPEPIALPKDPKEIEALYQRFQEVFHRIRDEIGKVIIGQREIIEGTLTCFLAKGNVLLEGVPGLGKTLLVRTFAQAINAAFSRIQFTPDLMPADITGTTIVSESEHGHRRLRFQPGPIFAHIILADEINRATPKTQSALLEAMQEHSVTVGGKIRHLEEPFFVLATQNPVEQEGTYPLPEAQLDRFFFKLLVPFPNLDELHEISSATTGTDVGSVDRVSSAQEIIELREVVRTVPIAPHVERYAARLVMGTHPGRGYESEMVKRFVRYGASPRGVQALVLGAKIRTLVEGRRSVACEDIRTVATAVLRHRLILNFEGEAEGITTDKVVEELLAKTPEAERNTA